MEFIVNLAVILFWAVSMTAKGAWWALRLTARYSAVAFAMLRDRRRSKLAAAAAAPEAAPEAAAAAAAPLPADDRFEPADRIYHVAFARGFSAKLFVYKARGEVRRVLSTTDATISRKMEYALMSTRIPLATLSLQDHSMEDILRDTEVAGAAAINKVLVDIRGVKHFEVQQASTVQPATAASEQVVVESAPTAVEAKVATPAPGAEVSSRVARKGVPITGIVLEAGETEAVFAGNGRSAKGTTFQVTLGGADGETSMRGVVLREQFERLGVKPGDHVSITPMGRQKVLDGGNDKGFMKNMFQVELLSRGAMA